MKKIIYFLSSCLLFGASGGVFYNLDGTKSTNTQNKMFNNLNGTKSNIDNSKNKYYLPNGEVIKDYNPQNTYHHLNGKKESINK